MVDAIVKGITVLSTLLSSQFLKLKAENSKTQAHKAYFLFPSVTSCRDDVDVPE